MNIVTILFPNITELNVQEDQIYYRINGVKSIEGEQIKFKEIYLRDKQADIWMAELEEKIKNYVINNINN